MKENANMRYSRMNERNDDDDDNDDYDDGSVSVAGDSQSCQVFAVQLGRK